jgi:hypothetical protein
MTTNPNEYVYSDSRSGMPGLTKREYFAAMAMQGLLVNYNTNGMYGNHPDYPMVEQAAVRQADALITALNENQ